MDFRKTLKKKNSTFSLQPYFTLKNALKDRYKLESRVVGKMANDRCWSRRTAVILILKENFADMVQKRKQIKLLVKKIIFAVF